ncbi:MAG TPA: undecaprenyldiphospho-muramoylpentapeptide beta-N-acetylglucosaminyltransferase [Chloroflexota bacterium]|nr:undecaprenyldiphospho-muramoylpentapeptide beta-N-acetylglucosaminyltransferase [Chloroflexota bacterium]
MTLRVLLAGGGSGGSSAPVLAVAQELRRRGECEFLYVGTSTGPERELVESLHIPFRSVSAGKLRRYWDVQNLLDLIRIPLGLAEAVAVVRGFRPQVAFAAGGFAAVPPLLAANLLGVPTVVHQQDVEPGLANRILAPFATRITVTFPSSLSHFPRHKTRMTGNPVREEVLKASPGEAGSLFGLEPGIPLVLATGGGTGAVGLNQLVAGAAPSLTPTTQLLHITGRGKSMPAPAAGPRYRQLEFLAEGMGHALAASTLVVSRAGLSTLTELAALGKPSILIPMPGSHQNANAALFAREGAALLLREAELDSERLAGTILGLMADTARLEEMADRARALMPLGAESRIADEIVAVARG